MRRVFGAAVALASIALLSSCALLPGLPVANPGDSGGNPDVQMQHIADAVKNHDADALKKLFTAQAREKATGLDSGLKYFISIFPSGRMTWKSLGASSSDDVDDNGKETVELFATYKVSADGKEYDLYFSLYTVNQAGGSKNVGIYSLGVAPYTAHPYTAGGDPKPLFAWESTGTPGVYIPQN
jgi:hypothetical protein